MIEELEKLGVTVLKKVTRQQNFCVIDSKVSWYALSTNMIDGWKPEKHDVEEMQEYIAKKIKSKLMNKFPLYDMYYYVDPNNEYTYPNSTMLRNKMNMKKFDELSEKEYQMVNFRRLFSSFHR